MQIDQISTHIPQALGLDKVKHEPKPQPQDSQTLSDQPDSVEQPAEDNIVDDNTEGLPFVAASAEKGVLRLLQEGHFKGVADVRLRINFHDELAAIEGAQLRTVSDEQAGGLTGSVGPELSALVDSGRITQQVADDALDAFGQDINNAIEDFLSGNIQSKDELASKLKTCFDAFTTFLSNATTPPAVDIQETEELSNELPVIEGPSAEQPIEEPQSELPDEALPESISFTDNLTTAFDTALTSFIYALDAVKVLPELSPPTGNGAAYQKFLEIYNDLYGLTPQSTPQDTASLDAST